MMSWSDIAIVIGIAMFVAVGMAAIIRKALAPLVVTTRSVSSSKQLAPLEDVKYKTFVNETVVLDGKRYVDCTFQNVTFSFGDQPFAFTHNNLHLGYT